MLRSSAVQRVLRTGTILFLLAAWPLAQAQTRSGEPEDRARVAAAEVVLDDFEAYDTGEPPRRWKYITRSESALALREVSNDHRWARVRAEQGNQFLRAYTENAAQRITLRNGVDFEWNVEQHPRLQWRWRAVELPEGANEKESETNDTGAAVYVTFGTDWLGRPKSIKYAYSSTLPVGTVVSYGPLKVLVVSTGAEPRTGEWVSVQRDVIADYRQLFGGDAPDRPASITLWSDADTMGGTAIADFDDLQILPPLRR